MVATFLLCCTEFLAQQETVPVTLRQKDLLVTRLEQDLERPKSPVVRRIIAWLHLFHTKAAHFGGRGLLSPRLLELLNDEQLYVPCLGHWDPDLGGCSLDSSALQQDLFHFYHELQHVSIRASGLDRHHRSRGTSADEMDISHISANIEKRLKFLSQGRPSILRKLADRPGMCDDQKDLEISHLVRLCILAYYAEVLYHARANGKSTGTSPDTITAKQTIRSTVVEINPSRSDDPALMWPLFQYAIESKTQVEVDWATTAMKPITGQFFEDFVRALAAEQLKQQQRVDSRCFCIKYSGMSPPFM